MTFAVRLRELREEKNMTQKAVAAVLCVSPRMVSFYESGDHFPRDESILFKLADLFEVSTDYLLGYSDSRYPEQALKAGAALEKLPEPARRSVLDYLEFLQSKYKYDRRSRTN